MKIYVVRHGQSENNLAGIHTGWVQCHLTENGRNDAVKAGHLLKNIHFDRVYCSDLIRAIETQELALPDRKADLCTPLLREISVGKMENKSRAQGEAEFGELYTANRDKTNFAPIGGENYEMLVKRVREFLTMLEKDPCDCAAIFCHAGVVKAILGISLELDETKGLPHVICDNGSVSVFEYRNDRWLLKAWNCTEGLFPL